MVRVRVGARIMVRLGVKFRIIGKFWVRVRFGFGLGLGFW